MRNLSVFDKHRLAIARKTLAMNDIMAAVMGGMTKAEARQVIAELTADARLERQIEKANAKYTQQQDKELEQEGTQDETEN